MESRVLDAGEVEGLEMYLDVEFRCISESGGGHQRE